MPYHLQVINRGWGDLDSRLQTMLLGFLKLGGAGAPTTGVAIAILLLIPFRQGYTWAFRSIFIIGFIYTAPVIYIAYFLHYSTGASTPLQAIAVMLGIILTAYLFTIKANRSDKLELKVPVK